MLKAEICGIKFRMGLLFPAVLVILFAFDDTGIPAWCLAASAMHEAGHFMAMYLLGCKPSLISIGMFGIRVEQPAGNNASFAKSMAISLAGPAVNLICFAVLAAATGINYVALIPLAIGVFNLLPMEYLDGGQFLYFQLAGRLGEERADRICFYISLVVLALIATAGFFLLIRSGHNFTLLGLSVYLGLMTLLKRK